MTINSHTTLPSIFDKLILYLFTSFILLMLLLFLKLLRKAGCLNQEMLEECWVFDDSSHPKECLYFSMSDRVTKLLFHHKHWVCTFKKYLNSRDTLVLLTEILNLSINISARTNQKPASAEKPSLCALSQSAHRNLDINSVTCNIKCITKTWHLLEGQQELKKLTILTINVILSKCRPEFLRSQAMLNIQDMDSGIEGILRRFADDTKCSGPAGGKGCPSEGL